ncbi:NAD(P)H-binding protein [Streptomyces sp. NBRC 110035]|uniref:NAD(P)H-binding protein n=1 Tax=Streptomyces sp. NBRC 110035 TaxID=1547867 RepID=UPI0007C7068D|nr:NAD(P)H-binding protein [Streptomyces sp. NBRC 110035]
MTVLVTGASGTTGSRLARQLHDRGTLVRRAGRSARADVRFDWTDPATFGPAVRGVRAVYLVAPIGVADPVPVVEPFLAAARHAGVARVALLGSSAVPVGSPGWGALGTLLPRYVPQATVLRPTWFASNFTGDHLHAESVRRDDEIVSATGDGRVPFIDPEDIASVARHVLTSPAPPAPDLVLTGPRPLGFDDVAATLTGFTGRTVRHRRVGARELSAHLRQHGIPAAFADLPAGLDTAIAAGAEDRTTTTVEQITGTAPRPFDRFLTAQPAAALRRHTGPPHGGPPQPSPNESARQGS